MPEQILNNRYKTIARLGKGAMGIVYRALDMQTGQEVAVKVIARELALNHDMLERFRREGEALRQLRHPNIVGFVDMFEHEEQHVIVMEFVPGGSLHQLLKQGPLPLDRTRRMALELCDALTRAHHLNIIHRDLKPENVMLAADGTAKLTDFGVARLISEGTRLTGTGTQVGTPFYMSPEAWEGKPLDAQTDIWSLGILLYEMLSGRVPFSGDTIVAVMNKVLNAPLPDLGTLRPDVPPGLAKIVERMLARDKSERYQSMRELAADLERGQPLTLVPAKPTRAKARPTAARPAKAQPAAEPKISKGFPWWLVGVAGLGLLVLVAAAAGLGGWWLASHPAFTATPTPIVTRPWTPPAAAPTLSPANAPILSPASATAQASAGLSPVGLGQGLWLDGSSGYVEIPYSDSLNLTGDLTLEAWVNLAPRKSQVCPPEKGDACNTQAILSQPNPTSSVGNYLLGFLRDQPLFAFEPTSGADVLFSAPATLEPGWHHLAAVHTFGHSAQTQLYLDGRLLAGAWRGWGDGTSAQDERPFPSTRSPYRIGYLAGLEAYYTGGLDEIRIWNVARSQAEIQATMKTELTGKEKGLAAYWNFNEAPGTTTAHDLSPNGNDGRLTGGAKLTGILTPATAASAGTPAPVTGALGTVLFQDNFDTGLSPRWDFQPEPWTTVVLDGRTAMRNIPMRMSTARVPANDWTDYVTQFDFKFTKPDVDNAYLVYLLFRANGCPPGMVGGVDDYMAVISTDFVALKSETCESGQEVVAKNDRRLSAEGWHTAQVIAVGNRVQVMIDGQVYLDYTDPQPSHPRGGVWLDAEYNVELAIDNFSITEIVPSQATLALPTPAAAPPPAPLKIGVLLPLSGPNAALGAGARDGAQMAVDEWNAQGGLLGATILPILADGQCQADTAVAAANRLFDQEHVRYLIGELCSGASIPVSAIAESKGVLQISPASTNSKVTLNDNGTTKAYVFRAWYVDPYQGTVMANFALGQHLQRGFVIWDQTSDFSRGPADYFTQAFEKGGGTMVGREAYSPQTTDFATILAKVADSQAQVLFVPDLPQRVNLIAQQAKARKVASVFMGGDGWEAGDLDLAALNGGYYSTAYSALAPNQVAQAWATRYRAKYGRDPDAMAALAYDAANLLFTAIRQANIDDPARVKDVLAGLAYEGITGRYTFDAQHNPIKSAVILQIKDGQRVYAGTVEP